MYNFLKNSGYNKKIVLATLIVGILGCVLFCPLRMNSGMTCLFHGISGKTVNDIPENIPDMEKTHLMVREYIVPFGLAWWFSIMLFMLSGYLVKTKNME